MRSKRVVDVLRNTRATMVAASYRPPGSPSDPSAGGASVALRCTEQNRGDQAWVGVGVRVRSEVRSRVRVRVEVRL